MPTSATIIADGAAKESFWTIIQGFFASIVLGCIFCNPLKHASTRGYAHYFPEGDGYLYITHLGSGNQGTALLVRSVSDQQNYVRKRKKFPSIRFPASNEAEFLIPMVEGDRLSIVEEVVSVSPEKTTKLGVGHFIQTLDTFYRDDGAVVALNRNTLFRFNPREAADGV